MIYDVNDVNVLLLPQKKIALSEFVQLRSAKRKKYASGGKQSGPNYMIKNKWDAWTCVLVLLSVLMVPILAVGSISVKNLKLYILMLPIFISFPVAFCIMALIMKRTIKNYPRYSAVCVGYVHRQGAGRRATTVLSAPLYRLETANEPMFIYCSFYGNPRYFPEIGQSVPLYINDKRPEECYEYVETGGIIGGLFLLGFSIFFFTMMLLLKIVGIV